MVKGGDRPLPSSPRAAPTAATSASTATPLVIIDNDKNPARHAHFRRRGPRTARPQFHENRQSRRRGGVMQIQADDTVEVITGDDRGRAAARCCRVDHATPASWSSKASTASTSTSHAASGIRRAAGSRRRCRCRSRTCCWSARPAARRLATGARVTCRRQQRTLLQEVRRRRIGHSCRRSPKPAMPTSKTAKQQPYRIS